MEDSSIRDDRTTTRTIALGVPASIGHEDRQTGFAEIEIDQASTLALLPVQRGGLDRLSQNIVNRLVSSFKYSTIEI